MRRAGWIVASVLIVTGGASAEDQRLQHRPLPTAEEVGFPATGAALSFEKDGKAFTGRLAGELGTAVTWEVGLTGADVDQATQRSSLLQTFAKSSGGTVDGAVTWPIGLDVRRAVTIDEARQRVCAERHDGNRAVTVEDLTKALDERTKAASTATALGQFAAQMRTDANKARQAVEDAMNGNAAKAEVTQLKDAADVAMAAAERAEATFQQAQMTLKGKAEQLDRLVAAPAECVALSSLTPTELVRVEDLAGTLPVFFVVKFHGRLGAQLFKYWDATTGADTKETNWPAELGVVAGIHFRPTMMFGAGVSRAWEWEPGDGGSICENQPVGGVTTNPPTLKCHDIALAAPTPSVVWKARLEWSQYFSKSFAMTPTVRATFKHGFLALPASAAVEFPFFYRLGVGEEKDAKWLVLGLSVSLSNDFEKHELTPGARLFIAATFPKF